MTKNKDAIIAPFKGKILGVRNYDSAKNEFFVEDFLSETTLDDFLDEVHSSESDITPAGKSFIQNYFGFNTLAKAIVARNPSFLELKNSSDRESMVTSWLENLQPLEILLFIEKAKNRGKELSIKEELLPPPNFD